MPNTGGGRPPEPPSCGRQDASSDEGRSDSSGSGIESSRVGDQERLSAPLAAADGRWQSPKSPKRETNGEGRGPTPPARRYATKRAGFIYNFICCPGWRAGTGVSILWAPLEVPCRGPGLLPHWSRRPLRLPPPILFACHTVHLPPLPPLQLVVTLVVFRPPRVKTHCVLPPRRPPTL